MTRGIIVLEGADCSGKTTLARHLVERYDARYLHGRVFPKMWRYHVAMVRLALRWADERLVVVDRLWLSELVYGPIFRGAAAYDVGARCLDRVLLRGAALNVLCAPLDQERQLEEHRKRRELGQERFANVQRVVAAYADLRHGNVAHPGDGYLDQLIRYGDYAKRHDVFVYDRYRDGHRVDTVCGQLISALSVIRGKQVQMGLDSRQYNLAGYARTATRLFVGDAVSPSARETRWPFCWHDGMSAATWLNRALHRLGFDETRGLWCNANEANDALPRLVPLGIPTIALGARAAERLSELGVRPRATLSHPQWHRRFRHGHPEEYVDLLREALR